jgi:uncharacterized protein (TIGR02246 family)
MQGYKAANTTGENVMKTGMMLAGALAGALALAGCGANEEAARNQTANQAVDVEAAAAAIRAEETQWNRDYAARNVDAIAARYAPGATLVEPGAAPKSGADAIRAGLTQMTADPAFRLEFGADHVQVAAAGDMGYSRGHFTLAMTDPQTRQPTTMRGSYLTVWQRQADGSWKALEDFITPGPAAGAGAAPAG